MRIAITPLELKVGDIYQGKRIVYVARQGETVYVDYEKGGSMPFLASGQIEVVREVETIVIEKG